ncbi:MAG: hypothetical protein QW041_00470 [Candidatus Pacearchaeota archaeon]
MVPKITKNKKGQEEIMGFILVVVMVVVIGIAFLFFFTPRAQERQDLELQNLLYSWLSVTINGNEIKETINNCFWACELDFPVSILDSSINYKFGDSLNGYSLNITGTAEFYYEKGNLTGNLRTAVIPLKDNEIKLRVYFS